MSQLSELSQKVSAEGGNTKTPSLTPKRYRRWTMTWNNYSEADLSHCLTVFEDKNYKYVIGKEVGESGTPHLQGYIESKNQVRFETLKKLLPCVHWEAAKGNREQNWIYCTKDDDFVTNLPLGRKLELLKQYDEVVWKPWQQDVLDIIAGRIHRRTIHWFWEEDGNVGKSFLCKYIFLKYDAIICEGKSSDVFNQVLKWMEDHPTGYPKVVICDIPRSSLGYVNYATLEKLKNGLVYSGKYEGGTCAFDTPHVICFANEPPTGGMMSEDRWNIRKI